jgi:hypothetical protein
MLSRALLMSASYIQVNNASINTRAELTIWRIGRSGWF